MSRWRSVEPGGIVVPKTTQSVSVLSSSFTVVAANPSRRKLGIHIRSTATVTLSYTNPATLANGFIDLTEGFVQFGVDEIGNGAIYAIGSIANGTLQVTEYV